MVVAIGSLLGIPLWVLLGWLAEGLWHRHEIKKLPGLFKTKVRMVSGSYRHLDNNFPHTVERAMWVHDVVILGKGLLVPRTIYFAIADGVQPPQAADTDKVKHLGDAPVTMQFSLDDGQVIEIAAPGDVVKLAQGPFFTGPNQYSNEPAAA